MADIITSPVGTVTGIAVDTTGKFTPGAAFSINASVDIINAAWGLGNSKFAAFEAKVEALGTFIQTVIDGGISHITSSSAGVPTIAEPLVTLPTSIAAADVIATFDAETTAMIAEIVAKVDSCMTTYFPNDSADFTAAETWLMAALADQRGLPVAVANQITTDDHARVLSDANRAADALTQRFASMRFPAPPGALAGGLLQIQQKAQDAMAESSRKITIASVEQLRWVVGNVLGLRDKALSAALEYAKTAAIGIGAATQITDAAYGAQSKLIGAISGYYGARTEAKKVVTSAEQFNATQSQDAAIRNQTADLTLIEDKVKALMTELQAIAQMTTSLFNNVHAGAGSSYSVSA